MKKDNKKIIILTGSEGGFGNLGDEWLLDSVKNRYKKYINKYKIYILKTNIKKTKKDNFFYIKDDLNSFLNEKININNIAIVHYYGGGYINDYWYKDKIWLYKYLIQNNFPSNKFVFTGQGLGPFCKEIKKEVQKIALGSYLFATRDLYFNNKIKGSFSFDESINSININNINFDYKKEKDNIIWINFRIADHVGINRKILLNKIRMICKYASKNNLVVNFLPMIYGKKLDEYNDAKKLLNNSGLDINFFKRPKNYKELIKTINGSYLMITTSYHATLASIYTNTPVISLYDNDYYKIKFNGLSRVLKSKILRILKINHFCKYDIYRSLSYKNTNIKSRLLSLKKCNEKVYNLIERKITCE